MAAIGGVVDPKTAEGQKKIEDQIAPMEAWARAISIKTPEDYKAVSDQVRLVKVLQGDADSTFDPTIKKYFEPYKFWLGIKKRIVERLELIEKVGKRAMITWNDEQEKIRKEEEARRQREALGQEEKKKGQLLVRAEKADARGDTVKAEGLRAASDQVVVPTAPVESAIPVIQGQSIRDNWVGEVVDLAALVKAIAEGRASIGFLKVDQVAVNKQAKATKDTFKIDGVRFWNDKTMAVSTKS